MTIEELVKEAYATAKNNGFHEDPIEFGTLIALIHTEVTEVLTAPTEDALAEELADILIRIYDMCGDKQIPLAGVIKATYNVAHANDFALATFTFQNGKLDIPMFCLRLHTQLSDAMEAYRLKLPEGEKEMLLATKIAVICQTVYEAGNALHLDINRAVRDKMEKNKNRPYKHNKII